LNNHSNSMQIKCLISILLILVFTECFAQPGGKSTYQFLNLPVSARTAALGGKLNAIKDNDLSLTFHNPSLLNSTMDHYLTINYIRYFADIHYGYVSYSRTIKNIGSFAAGLQYINYGNFISADKTGQITGQFGVSEYAFNLIWAREIDSLFSVGINLKPVISNAEKYTSFGFATDIGITYSNQEKLLTATIVVKNLGTQITTYYGGKREPLPFEIQLGVAHKLKHAPFCFSILVQHLETPKLTYENGTGINSSNNLTSGEDKKTGTFEDIAENLMRHMIFGVEITPIDNFFIRFGYNYRRRKELQIPTRISTVGFSWGFGINISKFNLSYGRATYHLAGASNHFSFSTDLSKFRKIF
jgi:hypothetical protein